jgi:hypothetical protein
MVALCYALGLHINIIVSENHDVELVSENWLKTVFLMYCNGNHYEVAVGNEEVYLDAGVIPTMEQNLVQQLRAVDGLPLNDSSFGNDGASPSSFSIHYPEKLNELFRNAPSSLSAKVRSPPAKRYPLREAGIEMPFVVHAKKALSNTGKAEKRIEDVVKEKTDRLNLLLTSDVAKALPEFDYGPKDFFYDEDFEDCECEEQTEESDTDDEYFADWKANDSLETISSSHQKRKCKAEQGSLGLCFDEDDCQNKKSELFFEYLFKNKFVNPSSRASIDGSIDGLLHLNNNSSSSLSTLTIDDLPPLSDQNRLVFDVCARIKNTPWGDVGAAVFSHILSNIHCKLPEGVVEDSVTSLCNYIRADKKVLFGPLGIRKDTLEFWKSKLTELPTNAESLFFGILGDVAMRLLSAGTSEACVERVFSFLKRILTAETTQMSQETLFYRLINCMYGHL